jgi:hypothetical protein
MKGEFIPRDRFRLVEAAQGGDGRMTETVVDVSAAFEQWKKRIADGSRVTASFKGEEKQGGEPFGPMFLTDHDQAEQYPVPGWITLTDARWVAAALGIRLRER